MLYVFYHIPKCGGTTIKMYYLKYFSNEKCLKVWNTETANCNRDNFDQIEKINDFKCVIGHLDFNSSLKNKEFNHLFLSGNIMSHSVVREPIDRIISLYNYIRNEEKHPSHQEILSVEPWPFLKKQPANFQSKWLGIDYFKTIDNLKKNINVISLEQSNEYFKCFFEREFNFSIPLMKKINVTQKNKKDLFDKSLLEKWQKKELKEKHFLDYDLYNSSFLI